MPVTVITGASGALGSAVATALEARQHRVARVAARDAAGWSSALATLTQELGPPTGAVLAAGGWRGGLPLHEQRDDGTWEAMLLANTQSVYRALRTLLPGMVERRAGSIVVIGSRAAVRPETSAGAVEYAASKAAAVALAQAAAIEVAPFGVRVNAVLPSTLDTPANRAAMPKADFSTWVPLESLAAVLEFLLSDASRDLSGAAIPVYGRT